MEEIYINVEHAKHDKPISSTNHTSRRSSKKSFNVVVILSLGLLTVFLLAGLITLGVHYHDLAADHSTMSGKLSSMTAESELLQANLTERTEELERLQSLSKMKKTCPSEWRTFSCSFYFFSESSDTWDRARRACRDSGADLVVIDSAEEQTFLSTWIKKGIWIGLNDIETEGTWKWVDGTPLTVTYWAKSEPNNGNSDRYYGEEDCGELYTNRFWNDLSCSATRHWVCEKAP